jgi:glyceraldehyde 3-phosphate dehydrogenase
VNDVFREEAGSDRYAGILGVSEDPIVSADIVGDARAAVIDVGLTRVVDGRLVKVMAWYDNEWGFTHQMLREVRSILGLTRRDDQWSSPSMSSSQLMAGRSTWAKLR